MDIKAWIKEHPYATGAIVIGGGIVFLLLRKGGSSAAGGTSAQLAAVNTAAALQMAQLQAGQNVASLQAQVATNQTNAQLAAVQAQVAGQVAITHDTNTANLSALQTKTSATADIYKALIAAGTQEQLAQDQLESVALSKRYDLAKAGVDLSRMGNRGQEGLNVVALALGQGDIGSYNANNSAEQIAKSFSTASIFNNLISTGGGILSSLF